MQCVLLYILISIGIKALVSFGNQEQRLSPICYENEEEKPLFLSADE